MFDYDDEIDNLRDALDRLYEQLQDLIEGTPEYSELELEIQDTESELDEAEIRREEELERLREEEEQYEYDADASEVLAAANATGDSTDWNAFRDAGGTNGSSVSLDELSFEGKEYIKMARGWEGDWSEPSYSPPPPPKSRQQQIEEEIKEYLKLIIDDPLGEPRYRKLIEDLEKELRILLYGEDVDDS
jgi:DNA repair exonuclease SbcCD ATPase subunit